jgi:hypothetical protein
MRARFPWVCAILATAAGAWAADRPPSLTDVLARLGDYVVRYERELSGIVAEEHYTQDADAADRPFLTHRELESDVLVVRAEGREGQGFVQFRDVFQVDGDPVRDRSERLLKLFTAPSATARTQAFQIMNESARYNIGSVERNVNIPLLALSFMHPRYRSRFKFTMDDEPKGVPKGLPKSAHFSVLVDVRVVNFREVGSPTLVDSGDRTGEARSRGRVWVEPETGRVLMTELNIEGPVVRSSIQVSYQSQPVVGFLVPVEMRETYLIPTRHYHILGTATYDNFRQFTVETSESILTGGSAERGALSPGNRR